MISTSNMGICWCHWMSGKKKMIQRRKDAKDAGSLSWRLLVTIHDSFTQTLLDIYIWINCNMNTSVLILLIYFREKSVALHGVGQLHCLFCYGCNVLLWLLINQIWELNYKCLYVHAPCGLLNLAFLVTLPFLTLPLPIKPI